MSALTVYLNAEKLGSLEQDAGGLLRFTYDAAWLKKPNAVPISRSLPLQAETFTGKKTRPFFAGILPEAAPREQIARILGISATNDFALLAKIGGECAGAVSLLPEDEAPAVPATTQLRELTERELEQVVAELPRRPLLAGADGLRLSLAGAQDKLPVVVRGGGICLPLGGAPSTHILKPEPERFPGLATNELFCMALARAIGLNVPATQYRLVGKKPCILVQRYDRAAEGAGSTTRIHQEDFCQALGFPPERKYQAEGGPTLQECVALLREWSTAPVLDIPAFVNSLIFNVLIGNADAHGKNYSLIYSGGERRLAPFYDLVSTLAWPELSRKLAMKIGDGESVNAFSPSDWKKTAVQAGLGWPLLRERLAETSRAVLKEVEGVERQIGEHGVPGARRLSDFLGARAARMIEALGNRRR